MIEQKFTKKNCRDYSGESRGKEFQVFFQTLTWKDDLQADSADLMGLT